MLASLTVVVVAAVVVAALAPAVPAAALNVADNAGATADATGDRCRPTAMASPSRRASRPRVSGHATFAAAWAGIMRDELGDNVTFTAATAGTDG